MTAYPNWELESGRGIKRTPIYSMQDAMGASWGCVNGWERPNWYGEGKSGKTCLLNLDPYFCVKSLRTVFHLEIWTPLGDLLRSSVLWIENCHGTTSSVQNKSSTLSMCSPHHP